MQKICNVPFASITIPVITPPVLKGVCNKISDNRCNSRHCSNGVGSNTELVFEA